MATSLALKRLTSSSALVSRLLRPSSVASGRAFNSNPQSRSYDEDRDVDPRDRSGISRCDRFAPAFFSGAFHPFSPTRSLSQAMNMKVQGMDNLLFSSSGVMGAMPRRGLSSKQEEEAKVIKGDAAAEKEDEAEMKNGVLKTVVKEEEKDIRQGNILRPLSPHLPIYKPQLTSTLSIANRISAAYLTAVISSLYLICLKMGTICFTYNPFYQFFFYSSKVTYISLQIAALALSYHVYYGVRHLLTDFSGLFFLKIGRKGRK